jgi:tRNA-5-taurinomethyluridine 2-sulfurtransferase
MMQQHWWSRVSVVAMRSATARRAAAAAVAAHTTTLSRQPMPPTTRRASLSSSSSTVVVALSGGVDSAVAAALLQQTATAKRMTLAAVHMTNWNRRDEDDDDDYSGISTSCSSDVDWHDAQRTALHLKLPIQRVVSTERDYWCHVFEPFVQNLLCEGRMGNPDVDCNTYVKFGALLHHVQSIYGNSNVQLATGHYARLWYRDRDDIPESVQQQQIANDSEFYSTMDWLRTWGNCENDPLLLAAADATKDQSYFLSGCSASALRHAIFPLGDCYKTTKSLWQNSTRPSSRCTSTESSASSTTATVRDLALHYALPVATKRESMGLCFVGKRPAGFASFVSPYLPPPRYRLQFVDVDTDRVVAQTTAPAHPFLYTPGQGARLGGTAQRYFVVDHYWNAQQYQSWLQSRSNTTQRHENDHDYYTIAVCAGTHHAALYSDTLTVTSMHWLVRVAPPPLLQDKVLFLRAQCRIRHLQPLVDCTVRLLDNNGSSSCRIQIVLDVPIRGICRGQTAVLYTLQGLVCLGGGPIDSRGPSYWHQGKSLPAPLHPSGHNDACSVT